jgi:hypothetical protein
LKAKHIRVGQILIMFYLPGRSNGGLDCGYCVACLGVFVVNYAYLLTQKRHKLGRRPIAFPPHPIMPIVYQSLHHIVVWNEERFTNPLRKTGG